MVHGPRLRHTQVRAPITEVHKTRLFQEKIAKHGIKQHHILQMIQFRRLLQQKMKRLILLVTSVETQMMNQLLGAIQLQNAQVMI